MKRMVQDCDGGFICMMCRKKLKKFGNMKKHLQEIHLRSGEVYYCPPCNKYYKAEQNIHAHIRKCHKDWGKDVKLNTFAVKQ